MTMILDGTLGITATGSLTGLTTAITPAQGGTGLTAVGTSGNLLTSNGTAWTSTAPAAAGPVLKYVTDTTDIAVTALAPTETNIGSTFSVSIPTSGYITIKNIVMKITNNAASYCAPTLGLRIGSTNYWLNTASFNSVTTYNLAFLSSGNSLSDVTINYNGVSGAGLSANYGYNQLIDIVASGIPTGTQTVQLIVGKCTNQTGNFTIGGTTVTTRVGIEFVSV